MPFLVYTGNKGSIRFGFHGLSYEYIMSELRALAGADVADGRIVIAHLGNGASMAAVHRGKSIETTMGFTPMGGLVMSTRRAISTPASCYTCCRNRGCRRPWSITC